tara:strand:+ start:8688 stop:9680 length:993 start_codon:yes stop_codon:yes gene_type:complete
MLNNKILLITGGTGSFGKAFVAKVLKKYKKIKKIIIFSRDELKQFEMIKFYEKSPQFHKMRFFLGDIRERSRLSSAFQKVDIVVHAAALKHVPASEYNPFEFIKTNIIGTNNVVEACLENKVSKLIALSTDKASSPINLYGATKLCSDKIVVTANNIKGNSALVSSVVRYGNVMASRGSIIPLLLKNKKKKIIELTDKRMTRFNISLDEAIELVLLSLKKSKGGEIFVPKIPSYRLIDLAKAICPNSYFKFTGLRPGEKIHEEMISENESLNTIEHKKYFVILQHGSKQYFKKYQKINGGNRIKNTFSYNSKSNKKFLTLYEIKKIISSL